MGLYSDVFFGHSLEAHVVGVNSTMY